MWLIEIDRVVSLFFFFFECEAAAEVLSPLLLSIPLTSNMTSLSGTKERSVSSRSRKYGVGYSFQQPRAGHTSVAVQPGKH